VREKPRDINNRVKAMVIDRQTMFGVLQGRITLTGLDLPDDAAIVEVHNDFLARGFVLIIWSYVFEPVEPGQQMPYLPPFLARIEG
jgi:hypothetical protein